MNMKKKVLAMIMAAVVLSTLLMGCGSESKTPDDVNPDSSAMVSTETETAAVEETESAGSSKTTLDEKEIYNNNGIVVTVTGMDNGLMGTDISVHVQNSTDQNILITAKDISVNDYMMAQAGLYVEVAAGKAANDNLCLYASELEECGIETIAEIEFFLVVSDNETWEEIDTSQLVTLTTSVGADFVQTVDDTGDVMYDSNGVRVICKGLKDDLIWSGSVVFYMENNTDRALSVYAENVSVNGYMEDVSLWSDMQPGKRAVQGMSIIDLSDLGIENIDEIDEIEFSLRIVDADTWEDIASTDTMTLHFE